jgi:hypothetical protein
VRESSAARRLDLPQFFWLFTIQFATKESGEAETGRCVVARRLLADLVPFPQPLAGRILFPLRRHSSGSGLAFCLSTS